MRRIVLVSGIWPPDLGGPASHAPELGRFLAARGHHVSAITMSVGPPDTSDFPVKALRRDVSLPRRMVNGFAAVALASVNADVVYATGMYSRSVFAAVCTRTPIVVKLTSDPAFERARTLGLFDGSLREFQERDGGVRIRALKALRRNTLERAERLVVPSRYLASLVRAWGIRGTSVHVVPNAVPTVRPLEPREEVRSRLGVAGVTLVFAGRFVRQKNLSAALAAIATIPEVTLVLIGEGPELSTLLETVRRNGLHDRVRFLGALPRGAVVDWLRAGDAALLSSGWENFPHFAIEALAVGTPVIATAVGGLSEIVEPNVNGTLVPAGNAEALSAAIQRFAADERVRERLRTGAAETANRFAPEAVFAEIERILEEAAA